MYIVHEVQNKPSIIVYRFQDIIIYLPKFKEFM